MENIIILIVGIAILISMAIILSGKKDIKPSEKSPIKKDIIEYPVVTPKEAPLKSSPLVNGSKKKSNKKSESTINKVNKKSETIKTGAKRGRKPKKDKGNDLLLS